MATVFSKEYGASEYEEGGGSVEDLKRKKACEAKRRLVSELKKKRSRLERNRRGLYQKEGTHLCCMNLEVAGDDWIRSRSAASSEKFRSTCRHELVFRFEYVLMCVWEYDCDGESEGVS